MVEDVRSKLFDTISVDRKKSYEKAIDDGKAPTEYFDHEFYRDIGIMKDQKYPDQ